MQEAVHGVPSPEELQLAAERGLYDPSREHDACGVGFVAHIKGIKAHGEQALLDDPLRLHALDVGDEANAAGIVLPAWVVRGRARAASLQFLRGKEPRGPPFMALLRRNFRDGPGEYCDASKGLNHF